MKRKSGLYLLSFLFLSLLFSCKSGTPEVKQIGINDISWLSGQWQTEPRNRVEVWSLRGNKYQASGLLLKDKNPRVNELMNISEKNGTLVYSVLAYGQNDNKYVDFKLSNQKPNDLIFTNPEHDFPKSIRYHLQSDNQLKVTVGDENEELSFIFFRSQ